MAANGPITANRVSGQFRIDNGRRKFVVPAVMLKVGVYSGSQGPLFYPARELAVTTNAWDGLPVVIDHPMKGGQPISAAAPGGMRFAVGLLEATSFRANSLTANVVIDVERISKLDPPLWSAISRGRTIEVSTGLVTANFREVGSYNGRPYDYVARNYQPDHLAILPRVKGACSVRDGCGLYQTNARRTTMETPLLIPTINFGDKDTPCGCQIAPRSTFSSDTCDESSDGEIEPLPLPVMNWEGAEDTDGRVPPSDVLPLPR